MPEYLDNPRRVPRETIRCQARLFLPTGVVQSTTEDIGARGCQVVVPLALRRGDGVALALSAPRAPSVLRVDGRVAWVSPQAPWRIGIAYAGETLPAAARWIEALRQAAPDLFATRRPPDRVAMDALVFLGPVPRLPDFDEEERAVLRAVGAGARVRELQKALAGPWPRLVRTFFSLLSKGSITLSRAAASHPVHWKEILGEPEVAPYRPAGTSAFAGPATPAAAQPPPLPAAPAPVTHVPAARTPVSSPPVAQAAAAVDPFGRDGDRGGGRVAPPPATAASRPPAPDFQGAGVGWRSPVRQRAPEAEALLQLARIELEGKRAHQALALLRRALALAPGDPEIAGAIGKALMSGRTGP